jgi:hypothetical protein
MKKLVLCPICKNEFKSLMSHLRLEHQITPTELLKKYPNTKLVSEDVKQRASSSCIKSKCGRDGGFTMTNEHKKKISIAMTGERNSFYGKKHSLKTRRKMSKNHADFSGDNNPLVKWLSRSPQNREIYSHNLKCKLIEKWSDEEYRKKHSERLSKQVSQQIINGFNPYSNCKRGWFHSDKFSAKFYFQSSYENQFLEFCEISPKITSLQRVPFVISYKDDAGIARNYCADFLINDMMIVEIKPKSLLDYNNNRLKINAAEKFCIEHNFQYKLLTEEELNNLEQIL